MLSERTNKFNFILLQSNNKVSIVCLWPICHRNLHYGKEIENDLNDLYIKRKELLKESGIALSIEELISYYK